MSYEVFGDGDSEPGSEELLEAGWDVSEDGLTASKDGGEVMSIDDAINCYLEDVSDPGPIDFDYIEWGSGD